jgi:hypothetical protein
MTGAVEVPDRLLILAVDLLQDNDPDLPIQARPTTRKTPPAAS